MTSKKEYQEAYAWIWLPHEIKPVVAGKLIPEGETMNFTYGKSYLKRPNAIAIHEEELPLRAGVQPLLSGLRMPGCIRDGAPDAWGRRVIINKKLGAKGKNADSAQLDELTYLLESGSDRIGALDFQVSSTQYVSRTSLDATLEVLMESAKRVEEGIPLTSELDQALHHGSSIGGARPKALIDDSDKKYIAKFSTSSDIYSIVKAEFVAMRLAAHVGLNVASVHLKRASGKDVLLIERFDRAKTENGWERKVLISALTLFKLDELMARYASYQDLAEIIRYKFVDAPSTLRELYSRLVFNILSGNTDDHARNHAAFWDGKMLSLSPAYDICPQSRAGNEASQAMLIAGDNRMSRLSVCLETAHNFLLEESSALEIMKQQIEVIKNNWEAVCNEAALNEIDRKLLWRRQFLNPYAFESLEDVLEV